MSAEGPCIDFCRYPELSFDDIGAVEFSGPLPRLTRLQLDLATGKARETTLFDLPCEFPQLHPEVQGARHRNVFVQTERAGRGPRQPGITRIDLDGESASEWSLPEGHMPSEPVLVPRGEGEDDVFVLDLVYDGTSDHSYVAVLDGQRLGDGPVATVHFDHAIPATFHGCFGATGLATAI